MERREKQLKKVFSNPRIIFSLKIIIAVTLLALLLHYIDGKKISDSIKDANPVYLLLGISLGIINIAIQWYRWKYLLQLVAEKVPNKDILNSIFIGIAAGFFTPGQIGEFAGRIAGHSSLSKSYVAGMSLVDKIYILTTTIFLGIPALGLFAITFFSEKWNFGFTIVAIVLFSAATILSIVPRIWKNILLKLPQKIRRHKYYSVIDIIESRFHTIHAVNMFLLTILFYAAVFIQYYVFILSFENILFYQSFTAVASVFFVKNILLPLSISDLGIRESAAVFFFSHYGIEPASAFNASMLVFTINLLIPSIIGSILILRLKISLKK